LAPFSPYCVVRRLILVIAFHVFVEYKPLIVDPFNSIVLGWEKVGVE
jgi:hypothetical protein